MELLYIWVKQYKKLKVMGLNFSNQFRLAYDERKRILDITYAENYIKGFFGQNITNFTGIIGENGTGKTSIFRYIIEYCSDGIHHSVDDQAIIVVQQNNQLHYFSSFDISFRLPTGIAPLKRIQDLEFVRKACTTIFLSNSFDPTSLHATDYSRQQFGDTKNLSTWYLLQNDYQHRTGEDALNPNLSFNDKLVAFATQELVRMVKLLRWLNEREAAGRAFPVKPPAFLNLIFYFDKNQLNKEQLGRLNNALNNSSRVGNSKNNRFLLRAFQAALYHLINYAKFSNNVESVQNLLNSLPDEIIAYLDANPYRNSPETSLLPWFEDILNDILESFPLPFLDDQIAAINIFLHRLSGLILNDHAKIHESGRILSIELSKVKDEILERLIDEYFSVDRISGFADFFFSHEAARESSISSGEYAMLIIFARLNDIKPNKNRPLWLLIDEAEMALHPQWQKQFIYYFLEFVNDRFADFQVQVILTSHSPFILSDLPPNCVILLKPDANNQTVVVKNLDKRNETFGANIHELFTDSFFLQDGLMGEFARLKIEKLIQEVNQKSVFTREEYDSLKRAIDIIGEPYIRFKLLERILQGMPGQDLDQVVIERQKELDLLKSIRNDKN